MGKYIFLLLCGIAFVVIMFFGSRLLCIYVRKPLVEYLQDNGGKHNQHQLPFDGNIDWAKVMKKISCTNYKGATTLEPMNWDYEQLSIREFLSLAFQKAVRIDNMRK